VRSESDKGRRGDWESGGKIILKEVVEKEKD
jgi:hypothetical protein